MASPYHIGAQNIATRLGYKSKRMVWKLVLTDGLPVYKRYVKTKTTRYTALCISESALTAWELAKGRAYVSAMRARQEERGRVYGYALPGR